MGCGLNTSVPISQAYPPTKDGEDSVTQFFHINDLHTSTVHTIQSPYLTGEDSYGSTPIPTQGTQHDNILVFTKQPISIHVNSMHADTFSPGATIFSRVTCQGQTNKTRGRFHPVCKGRGPKSPNFIPAIFTPHTLIRQSLPRQLLQRR